MGEVGDGGEGETEAEDGSGGGEDEGFREELADDAAACGSECGAHGELLGAGGGAGEQEVREVDADDEKDESDGSPEDDERAAETAGDVVLEVPELGGVVGFVSLLYAEVEGWEEEVGFGLGLCEGDAGVEAAGERDHVAVLADLIVEVGGEDVHFGAGGVDGAEVEGVGKDADDCGGRVAERDGLADDVGIAVELALPEWVAEDDDWWTGGAGFFGGEGDAAHQRLYAQSVEEVVHDIDLGDGDGDAATGELPVAGRGEGVVAGEVGEGFVLALELLDGVGGVGGAGGSALGDFGGDADEAVCLGEWERAQQDGVDDGEDDDVGADAESEDEDGDDGEAGVAAKGSERCSGDPA